jgi:hypothetical protein
MSWFEYESAAERKASVQRKIEKRRKRGESFVAFDSPKGTRLTSSFWGLAWCRHLENYCGYENRLPKGRTYLRQGNVYNFSTDGGKVSAEVAGSDIYTVEISLAPLPPAAWKKIKAACAGQVSSLLDLLSGKLGDHVMKIVTDPLTGLFPRRQEIRHGCSCPDFADLCKHQAAVLYAIGVRFDQDPKTFFELRGVDPSELIAVSATALTGPAGAAADELAGEDLSALFGIDFAVPDPEPVPVASSAAPPAQKASGKKTTGKKTVATPAKKAKGRPPGPG